MQTLDYSYQKVIIIRNLCQMSKIELGFFFERDRADMGKQDLKKKKQISHFIQDSNSLYRDYTTY